MNTEYLIPLVAFCACFVFCYVWLRRTADNLSSVMPDGQYRKDAFLPLYTASFAAVAAITFLTPDGFDQIYETTWPEILAVFIGAGLIYAVSLRSKTTKLTPAAVLAVAILAAFLLPKDFMLFNGVLPWGVDRALIIIFWFLFTFCYRYLNGIDGMLSVQNLGITAGIFLLAVLGAVPWLTGNYCAALLGVFGAFAIFNWYPARLVLQPGGCMSLGFILGWLLLVTCREGSAGSALILILYYVVEMLFAAVKKFSLKPENQNFLVNTIYYQTNISGLSPAVVSQNIMKINGLLIIISCFQIFSPNYYSLPGLSLLLTLWFIGKIKNWQEPTKTLKEINQDFIQEVKENVEDIKKIIK